MNLTISRRGFLALLLTPIALPGWLTGRSRKAEADPLDEPLFVEPVPVGQPLPRAHRLIELPGGWTVLQRRWQSGDAARCRLCPAGRCVAGDDVCLLAVPVQIAHDEAPLFNAHRFDWEDSGDDEDYS